MRKDEKVGKGHKTVWVSPDKDNVPVENCNHCLMGQRYASHKDEDTTLFCHSTSLIPLSRSRALQWKSLKEKEIMGSSTFRHVVHLRISSDGLQKWHQWYSRGGGLQAYASSECKKASGDESCSSYSRLKMHLNISLQMNLSGPWSQQAHSQSAGAVGQ